MANSASIDLKARAYPECGAGGFTRWDGTIAFLTRVSALMRPGSTVLDLGAGRGAIHGSEVPLVRSLADFRARGTRVIGLDIDPAVRENPGLDEALVYDGGRFPLKDESVDLIVSDYVLEHVEDPAQFAAEADRVLKPGGWFCARTPYRWSLLAMVTSLIPSSLHQGLLKRIQPSRRSHDVFPTKYRFNTFTRLRRYFPRHEWRHCSYTWSPEPSYHAGLRVIFDGQRAYQWLKMPFSGEVLLIFLQKKPTSNPEAI